MNPKAMYKNAKTIPTAAAVTPSTTIEHLLLGFSLVKSLRTWEQQRYKPTVYFHFWTPQIGA